MAIYRNTSTSNKGAIKHVQHALVGKTKDAITHAAAKPFGRFDLYRYASIQQYLAALQPWLKCRTVSPRKK